MARLPELHPPPQDWPGSGRIVVAFSGGPDSLYLLHRLLASGSDRPVHCLHVDHGLDPGSGDRAQRARTLAEQAGTQCVVVRVHIASGSNQEARAREARYQALAEALEPGDVALTAHHADDQVETVLMRLLRGSGPAGLAGMPVKRALGRGWLVRPLLGLNGGHIRSWLEEQGLEPVRDPANQSLRFDRNVLRHQVLPAIRKHWPGATSAILRSARLHDGAARTLAELTRRDLAAATEAPDRLLLEALDPADRFRSGELMRYWCHQAGLEAPPGSQIEAFLDQLNTAAADRVPELAWREGVIRRWNNRLWLNRKPEPDPHWTLNWQSGHQIELPDGIGTMLIKGGENPPCPLQLCSGKPGERLKPAGHPHSHNLNQLLAEHGVPPWQRNCWPRLWLNDRLVGLGDRWQSSELRQWLQSHRIELSWRTPLYREC